MAKNQFSDCRMSPFERAAVCPLSESAQRPTAPSSTSTRRGKPTTSGVLEIMEIMLLRNNLLPPRYPVCGLWQFQVPDGRFSRPPSLA